MRNFRALEAHEIFMHRCLQLARLGEADTAPNPMVGAVLVHKGVVIGEGYHQQYGGPHAEVNCMNNVSGTNRSLIKESTLYVSLEPCNHFGKTGPCTTLIISHQIPEVVIACKDPFSKVNGSGIRKLEDAGIKVNHPVLETEATELNRRFFTFHNKKRPYIILKWAASADHKIAGENSRRVKISNVITDKLVHQWRSLESGIIVGTNTILQDDPALTNRHWTGKSPVRIFFDHELKIPPTQKIMDKSVPTIIINNKEQRKDGNNLYLKCDHPEDLSGQLLPLLYEQNIQSLIVEGGAKLLQSFIDAGLWDEARIIINTKLIIGKGLKAPLLKNEILHLKETIRHDAIYYYRNRNL